MVMGARLPFGWGRFIAIAGEFTLGLLWGQEDRGQKRPPGGAESKHPDAGVGVHVPHHPTEGRGLCLSHLFSVTGSLMVQPNIFFSKSNELIHGKILTMVFPRGVHVAVWTPCPTHPPLWTSVGQAGGGGARHRGGG